ncbi:MAG: glycosyltransferase family 2 protein [Pseudoxanthomonas sp.]
MRLEKGWYRLRLEMRALDGAFRAPALELTHADGGKSQQPLVVPAADGRVDELVLFGNDAIAVALLPSVQAVSLRVAGLRLQRLGRVQWMWQMLSRYRTRAGGVAWGDMASHAWQAGLCLLRGAPAQAGKLIADRYQLQLRPDRADRSYAEWAAWYDTPTAMQLQRLRQDGERLASSGPLVSLLVPVWNTPPRWLRACLDSVLAQAYPKWELCIADDASTAPHVRQILDEYAAKDARIRVVYRPHNGHISEASNSALALVSGEWIGLLDHDDELRPHALLRMVEALQAHPDACFLYSDEDKIGNDGQRYDPYFKPDWNPDLLLGQNYLCHFTMIDATLVREVGGFRKGCEGSQDHDLFLRCVEGLQLAQIVHVPHVLYHWRASEQSTAAGVEEKPYALINGVKVLESHLRRVGRDADRVEVFGGYFRVRRALPSPAPKVSLVIPTRDKLELLRLSVGSILTVTDYPDFEILVVDNQSSDPETLRWFDEVVADPRVRVLRFDAPFNYSAINNFAVAQASGELVGLVNNDIEAIHADWLAEMASQAMLPHVGAVGAMLYYPDDTIQHGGVIVGLGGVAGHAYAHEPRGYSGNMGRSRLVQDLGAVTAACMLVRKSVYEAVGGLDEELAVAFNDVDFCLRIRERGLFNLWTPFAELYHHESASRGYEDTPEKQARFAAEVEFMKRRWGKSLTCDPAYNPNLSLTDGPYRLAFPPRHAPLWGDRRKV